MSRLKNNLVFYIIMIVNICVLPIFIRDMGSAILIMLIIMPLICLVTSFIYGYKNGFRLLYALGSPALYTATLFIFYNSTAWIYVSVLLAVSLFGMIAALPFRN